MSEDTPLSLRDEALEVVRALRAHLSAQVAAGTTGLPRSAAAPTASLTEPPASQLPSPVTLPESMSPPRARGPASIPPASRGPASIPPASRPAAVAPAVSVAAVKSAAVLPVLDGAERRRRLEVLAARVAGCSSCGLHATRIQTVFSRGTGSSGLCFVGEGPGADEDAKGEPFVGKAGQLLDRMILAMGLGRDEVYVCNIVKCRPPENRKPEPEEMKACIGYLEEQLDLLAPQVIVALGATAVQGLLGLSGGITQLRGTWRVYRGRTPVMPTFHPAYLLRSPSAKHPVWEDMLQVLTQLGRPLPPRAGKP
jgi:uracil-DNA glycosylase